MFFFFLIPQPFLYFFFGHFIISRLSLVIFFITNYVVSGKILDFNGSCFYIKKRISVSNDTKKEKKKKRGTLAILFLFFILF